MKKTFKRIISNILTFEAKFVLKKYKPKIVAITGSVGKTSTKDAIYTVLAHAYKTRKSEKSFNSDIGIPLTILGLSNGWSNPLIWIKNIIEGLFLVILPFKYPEWLVLEIGADSDRPTYMTELSRWLTTDIVVFTTFAKAPVHVEYFGSREALLKEKASLLSTLKESGNLIINHDDEEVRRLARKDRKTIFFGFNEGASIRATYETVAYGLYENSDTEFPVGQTFKIDQGGSSIPISVTGALGRQHIYPLLAAFAVGISQSINPVTISEALSTHVTPPGRMKLVSGIRNTLIIDDTYNSSPVAVEEALKTLKNLKTIGRRIAVLGDMLELGDYSREEHMNMGKSSASCADIVVMVGIRSRLAAEAALDAGMDENAIFQFETSGEAGRYLQIIMKAGDIILIKGSQAMRTEKIVEEVMAHPEDKDKLLVRQSKHWQGRR